jgi:hypothetical protein
MPLYVVAAAALVWRYRRVVIASRHAQAVVAAGIGLFAFAGVLELVIPVEAAEEVAELLGALVLFAGFLLLAADQLMAAARSARVDPRGPGA